jgi:hypothetical protein
MAKRHKVRQSHGAHFFLSLKSSVFQVIKCFFPSNYGLQVSLQSKVGMSTHTLFSFFLKSKSPGQPGVYLVVTSALTSADVSLTSGNRSPDETDGAAGSVTHSIFVRFTSNFVHLHSLPSLQERIMSRFSLINFCLPKFLLDGNLEITDGKGNTT